MSGKTAWPEVIIASGILLLASVVYYQTTLIPVAVTYAKIGPNIIANIISALLAILGGLLMYKALRGGWQDVEEKEIKLDLEALFWVFLGLTLNVALISKAGFTLSSIALFVCVARAFGSRNYIKNAGIAAIIALVSYFGFSKLLKINIGSGLVENLLERLF